jgi:ABC-type polysaccharide/polyol phosphate export permease
MHKEEDMITALVKRDLEAAVTDSGRLAEMIVFPASFLVIWGLLYQSDLISREIAGELLVVNLIWTVASQFQSQANLGFMMDLWSREFSELFKEGLTVEKYVLSRLAVGTMIGGANLLVFLIALPLVFGASSREAMLLLTTLPVYYAAAMGLALVITGSVVLWGRSYGFLAWTGLQFLIMLSSPYSPVESLPWVMRYVAYLSPFTYVFEYVREGGAAKIFAGMAQAGLWVLFGLWWVRRCFAVTKSKSGLVNL